MSSQFAVSKTAKGRLLATFRVVGKGHRREPLIRAYINAVYAENYSLLTPPHYEVQPPLDSNADSIYTVAGYVEKNHE
jgi:hypothetical protein